MLSVTRIALDNGLVVVQFVEIPLAVMVKIVGQLADFFAQLQGRKPAIGDGRFAVLGAEQLADENARGVRIAVVVDGKTNAMLEIVGNERTIDGNAEGFFADPGFTELRDGFLWRRAETCQFNAECQCLTRFVSVGMRLQQVFCALDADRKGIITEQRVQNDRKRIDFAIKSTIALFAMK